MLRSIALRSNKFSKSKYIPSFIKNKKIILTNPWSGKIITKKRYPMNRNTIKNVVKNYFPIE